MLTPDSPGEMELMSPTQLNALLFGAIKISRDGTILSYNVYESKLSGRLASEVIGRNFFTEVAPCTAVQEFYGTFREMIGRRAVHEEFDFVFALSPPVKVHITLLYELNAGVGWILVKEVAAGW
ncbi:MAG: photoactive yellow protein [Pyrinomonadaceae bacterium]